jgi:flagella basal body P-ring formation protein FlgA
MREALPFPVTRLEITEISQYPAPRGRIEFKREGLGSPASSDSAAPVIWRGSVVYGENRKFSIWARVIVTATLPRVVAVEALKRGAPIHASQVRAETVEGFPSRGDLAQNTDEVVGKAPWRDIPAETPIRLAGLTQAPDVSRGDTVEVEVRAGAARLALTAKAESAGRSGELITVRNLTSNRVFAARVSGKGRARVDLETNHAN